MRLTLNIVVLTLAGCLSGANFDHMHAEEEGAVPERVTFMSGDAKTALVGYVYKPRVAGSPRLPAVIMMHGRGGPYSTLADGVYDATTLSLRHKAWGREWAQAGYIAILVDGFGPRGYAKGFPRFSYNSRPEELNEVTIRPLDAYGALAYLRSRADVIPDRIGLQGWSNGGSAAIATMSSDAPGIAAPTPETGFRAALVFYPACGLKGRFHPWQRTQRATGHPPRRHPGSDTRSYRHAAQLLRFFAAEGSSRSH